MSGPSKATQLVELALERYRLGCSTDGAAFAVEVDGPNVALSLRGRGGLRSALAADYYGVAFEAPGQNALSEAMQVLEGRAMAADREPVAIRMAAHDGAVVVDLGRADGQVTVVRPGTWSVVARSPVLFRSTEAVGELPLPIPGGTPGALPELQELLNVPADDWPVIVAFLVAALMADLAHPVLFLSGEQGTAKSWAARVLVRTFDGSQTDVQSAPRNEDDWAVVASSAWSVALDNVSKIDPWLSDAICRAATGAMWRKRALFTDDAVSILRVKRVVVLNGIDPEITRGDLAERLIRVDLDPIRTRRTDEEIEAAFGHIHPRILGTLFDLAAQVLAVLPSIEVERPPRMASFAKVVAAVDQCLATQGLKRYCAMVQSQVAQAAEGDLFAQALDRFLTASTSGEWEGAASDLLRDLRTFDAERRDELPKTPQAVGSALSRVATPLRARGWTVKRGRGAARRWTIRRGNQGEIGVVGVEASTDCDTLDARDASFLPIPPDAELFDEPAWVPDEEDLR